MEAVPDPLCYSLSHVMTILLRRQRILPLVAFQIAVTACCGNIPCRIVATIYPRMKMFGGALEPLCLRQRVFVSFGKGLNVLKPHWLTAVVAASVLSVVGRFAEVCRSLVRHMGSFNGTKDEPR